MYHLRGLEKNSLDLFPEIFSAILSRDAERCRDEMQNDVVLRCEKGLVRRSSSNLHLFRKSFL